MNSNLKGMLDKRTDLEQFLFCRGFLVTDQDIDISACPFYGHWAKKNIGGVLLLLP